MTKILAAAGLGVMGATLLTGCSLSKEQQMALDLVAEKADKLIELTEKNMQLTNSQLSKADAAEMILLARTKLALGLYDEMYVNTIGTAYTGYFDKVIGNAQGIAPHVYFRKTKDFKYVGLGDYDGTLVVVTKADFTKDKIYTYTEAGTVESNYDSNCFDLSSQLDIFNMLGFGTVTAEDIVNIENLDGSYKFNLMKSFYDGEGTAVSMHILLSTVEISKTGDILGCEFDLVNKALPKEDVKLAGEDIVEGVDGMPIIENYDDITVAALNYKTIYKYTDIDFIPVEAIASGLGSTNA